MIYKLDLGLPKKFLLEKLVDYFISDRRLRSWLSGCSRRQSVVLKRLLAKMLASFSFSLALFVTFYLVKNLAHKVGFVSRSSVKSSQEAKNDLALDNRLETSLSKEVDDKEQQPFDTTSQATPTSLPTPTSTPESYQNISQVTSEEANFQERSFKIPEYLVPYTDSARLNLRQGRLKIRITADWADEEMPLFWGNFNGSSKDNLFEIAGRGPMLVFNTYDEKGEGRDSLEVDIGGDYKGKTFEVEAKWNFESNLGVKELFIDGQLLGHEELTMFPAHESPIILVGAAEVSALSGSF